MRRTILAVILVAAFLIAGFNLCYYTKASQAEEKYGLKDVMAKLGDVLKGQQAIIQRLDEMKEELHIVKIRASR